MMDFCENEEPYEGVGNPGYADLLKPIRDLNKNWKIDISASLQKFLMQVSLNDNICLNFGEAGLVIQGSVAIYSKKVDHLYNLVFDVLQNMKNVSKEKEKEKGSKATERPTSVQEEEFDEVSFDKEVVINMKDSQKRKITGSYYKQFLPLSLIPLEDTEKGNINLVTGKDEEIIGNCMDYVPYCFRPYQESVYLVSRTNYKDQSSQQTVIADDVNGNNSDDEEGMDFQNDVMEGDSPGDDSACNFDVMPGLESFDNAEVIEAVAADALKSNQTPARIAVDVVHNLRPRIEKKNKDFILLDPHAPISRVLRPIRALKRFNIPEQLLTSQDRSHKRRKSKQKRNGDRNALSVDGDEVKEQADQLMPFWDYCSTYMYFDSKASKNLFNPSLSCLLIEEIKERNKTVFQKRLKIDQVENVSPEGHHSDIDELDDNCSNAGDDLPDDFNDIDIPMPDFNNLSLNVNSEEGLNEDAVVSDYTELIRQHWERYNATVQKYQKTTEIDKRVNEWKERITPFLEEQEERTPFDIRVYSSKLLDCFGNKVNQELPFSKIVEDKQDWEVSRYFLTSLLLTNQGNLDIKTDGVLEAGINTMALTLLSKTRHEDLLNSYPVEAFNS